MSKVYIVTRGIYSDYGIEKVFTTREAAEKYCAIDDNQWDEPRIEEWELEDGSNIECEKVYKAIACSVGDDHDRILNWEACYSTSPYKFEAIKRNKQNTYTDYIIPIHCDVTDYEVIKKIIYDTVAQYKAETLGL